MASSGRDIKAFLTLDVTQFNRGLSTARRSATGFKRELEGLNNTVGGISNQSKKSGQDIDSFGRSVDKTGTSANKASTQMGGLKRSMGLLSTAAGLLAVTLGMELGMQIMQVANSAVNAQGQIQGMARGMKWTAQQTKAYTNEMDRLQAIYKKTDMNTVGTEVAKMARIYKLNAEEAKNFIETSAVFSSAMAGEGRTARDSALALKDLIDQGQGWERRLSEIGVTGEALKKTGLWTGNKDDKKGIIAALNQVLEERSLSQMAKEINSLDDALKVLTIAGGQLLGAVLIPTAPLIYGIVMALADLAYWAKAGIGWLVNGWDNLPDWVQIALGIGGITLGLSILGAVMINSVIPSIKLYALSLFGAEGRLAAFGLSSWAAFAPYLLIAGIIVGVTALIYELGKSLNWWTDLNGMLHNTGFQIGALVTGVGLLALSFNDLGIKARIITPIIERLGFSISAAGAATETVNGGGQGSKGGGATKGKGKGGKSGGGIMGTANTFKDLGGTLKAAGRVFIVAAVAIAMGMALITEAIILLNGPMLAFATIGMTYSWQKSNIDAGIKALKETAIVLVPIGAGVAILATGMSIFVTGTGGIGLAALAVGMGASAVTIAMAIGVITATIYMLNAPLYALANIGDNFPDISNIKRAGESLKIIGEAVKSIADITGGVADVAWNDLKTRLFNMGNDYKGTVDTLNDWLQADGLIDSLNEFASNLNGKTFNGVSADKIKLLTSIATSIVELNKAVNALGDINWDVSMGKLLDGKGMPGWINTVIGDKGVTKDSVLGQLINFAEQVKGAKIPDIGDGLGTNIQKTGDLLKKISDTIKTLGTINWDTDVQKFINPTRGYFTESLTFLQGMKSFTDQLPKSPTVVNLGGLSTNLNSVNRIINQINVLAPAVNKVPGANLGKSYFGQALIFMQGMDSFIKQLPQRPATNLGGVITDVNTVNRVVQGIPTVANVLNSIPSKTGYFTQAQVFLTEMKTFIDDVNGKKFTNVANIGGVIGSVNSMITQIKTTISNASGIQAASMGLGSKIPTGIKAGMGNGTSLGNSIVSLVSSTISGRATSFKSSGSKLGTNLVNGFKTGITGFKGIATNEVNTALSNINGKESSFYSAGSRLGSAFTKGFKDAADIHSPGLVARMTAQEMDYTLGSIEKAIPQAYNSANSLGQSMVDGFNPQLTMNAPNVMKPSVPDLAAFNTNATNATLTAQNAAQNTQNTFQGMNQNLTSTFNSMGLGVNQSYTQMKNKTISTMGDLRKGTSTEIGSVVGSWNNMKTSLIESASHIRTKTASHINKLQGNMGSFWKKVRNPVLLLGGAGPSPSGSMSLPRFGGFAGPGGRDGLRLLNQDPPPCFNPDGCYAGWDYNWTPGISNNIDSWKTNFGSVYDPYLNIGKFTNNNFPVRGNGNVYEALALDMIGKTQYDYYFNSNGLSPAQNFLNGSFNCYDGALLLMSLASSFGLNSSMEHGFWENTPHVWANIEKVGRIDATAIQHGYGKFAHGKVHAGPSPGGFAGAGTITKTHLENKFEFTFILPEKAVENQEALLDNIEGQLEEKMENTFYKLFNETINGE